MLEDIIGFFKSFTESVKSKKKNILIISAVVCVLLITVPTSLAVYYAYFYNDTSYLVTNNVKVELWNGEGALLGSEEVAEANLYASEIAGALYSIQENKIKTLPPEEIADKNFEFAITEREVTRVYSCYFADTCEGSYIWDSEGTYYIMEENSFNAFLNSPFSESLYASAKVPVLITGNGDAVTPSSAVWHYEKQDGRIGTAKNITTTAKRLTYEIGGSVNLFFDQLPTDSNITLRNSASEKIYDGPLEDVHYVLLQAGSHMTASVSASWEATDGTHGYGEIKYEFDIILKNRASFSASTLNVTGGEFVLISGFNVEDISRIVFSMTDLSEIERSDAEAEIIEDLLALSPTFVRDGDYVRTLIPFPVGTPQGKYNISVAFGVEKANFTIKVTNTPTENVIIDEESSEVSPLISKKSLSDLAKALKVSADYSDRILFRDSFLSLEELGFSAGYSFNDTVFSSDEKLSFTAKGNEYIANISGGAAVPALNIGTVVASGYCSYLGNYVVIDHGMGLRTWYCCLDAVTVSAGDTVAKGDTVGRCGEQGLISSSGVLILCSVYETLIDPSFIMGNDVKNKP